MVVCASGARGARALRSLADLHLVPSVPAGFSAPPQLQKVVRPADHFPLRLTVGQSASLEPVDPAARLGLTEHRFDDLAALLVQAPSPLRQKLAVHPLALAQMPRDATARRRCLAHLLPLLPVLAGRYEQLR